MPSYKSATPHGTGPRGGQPGNRLLSRSVISTNYFGDISFPGTPEQRSIAVDILQFGLDLGGIFEPTPFCDISSGLISLGRKEWLNAGISALSIIPYIGDLAKVGKLPKYLNTIRKAVRLASEDAKFAEHLRPLFLRLKTLLADLPPKALPEAARGTIAQIKAEVDGFLKGAKVAEGPITKILARLPEGLKKPFEKALGLPLIRNPRKLAKHHGPVSEKALLEEILRTEKSEKKGFELVKKGDHKMAGKGESSDVYLRKVLGEDGKTYYEAIRIDRKLENTALRHGTIDAASREEGVRGGIQLRNEAERAATRAEIQAEGVAPRRVHHSLGETLDPLTGHPYSTPEIAGHLNAGRAYKGDFSHWHHETFPASPENLEAYLKPGAKVNGLKKLDSGGEVVNESVLKHRGWSREEIPGMPKKSREQAEAVQEAVDQHLKETKERLQKE